jgi:hypothetical protein
MTPGPRDERGVLAARIVAAAREEFAEHGWAGTTLRAVARAADVDPALVYHRKKACSTPRRTHRKSGWRASPRSGPRRWTSSAPR